MHVLTGYLDRLLQASALEGIERHLASCASCAALLASGVIAAEFQPASASVLPSKGPRRRVRIAAVAAGIALGTAVLWGAATGRPGAARVTSGHLLAAGGGPTEFGVGTEIGAREGARALLSDGTLLTLGCGGRMRLGPPEPGERTLLHVTGGCVRLDVAKGPGAVRVVSGDGYALVRGTVFEVRILPSRLGAPAGTEVFVQEGEVEAGAAGYPPVLLRASEGTFLFPGTVPARHVWDPDSSGRFAASREASLVGDRPATGASLQVLLACLERAGAPEIAAIEGWVRDEGVPLPRRVRWCRILGAMELPEATEALARLMEDSALAEAVAPERDPHDR